MIREDRELLAEMARLNTAMAPLALRVMDGSASVAEQRDYAQCMIAAGERLWRRAEGTRDAVIGGEVLAWCRFSPRLARWRNPGRYLWVRPVSGGFTAERD